MLSGELSSFFFQDRSTTTRFRSFLLQVTKLSHFLTCTVLVFGQFFVASRSRQYHYINVTLWWWVPASLILYGHFDLSQTELHHWVEFGEAYFRRTIHAYICSTLGRGQISKVWPLLMADFRRKMSRNWWIGISYRLLQAIANKFEEKYYGAFLLSY